MVNRSTGYITPNINVRKIISDQLCKARVEALEDFKFMTIKELKEFNAKNKEDKTKTKED